MRIVDLNRSLAQAVLGPTDTPVSAAMQANEERVADGLTPFIVAGAAYFALGGIVDKGPGAWKRRKTAAAISALLFLSI